MTHLTGALEGAQRRDLLQAGPVLVLEHHARRQLLHDAADHTRRHLHAESERVVLQHEGDVGADRLPPRAKPNRTPKGGAARLTWIGFQQREGVPTVFVQLDKPVAWSLDQSDGKLIYTLVGATVPIPNNRRKLDAKEFGTTVQTVEARRKGRDVEVIISVKGKVAHFEKNEDGAGGYKFLVIGLPQG